MQRFIHGFLAELNDIKDVIRADVSASSYGKFTKGSVYFMLAKMYLNAMVWNPGRWSEMGRSASMHVM